MATTHFSIERFYGAKHGSADNLVQLGCAAEAVNVDTSDGALQTLVGGVPYPTFLEMDNPNLYGLNPELLWEDTENYSYYISNGKIIRVYADWIESGPATYADIIYDPALHAASEEAAAAEEAMLRSIDRLFMTSINGERVVIGLCDAYDEEVPGPVLIQWHTDYEHGGFEIRPFGTGMFITSDAITAVTTGANSVITGVKIGRAMTLPEKARCLYAGVYIMATENEQLDFTAAYVSACTIGTNETTLTFKDALPAGSVSVGNYIKVRGGLSNQPVSFMHTFFGRLFAAGDVNFPNRLYWSCLPGDGRTIEDWTADDASPDTGGGYVQVGDEGYISALFSYQSQLLIWKGDELWRLYGATPSQYTLELVFRGAGRRKIMSSSDVSIYSSIMQNRVADVHGVPYVLLDEGLYYYDGNSLNRVDSDNALMTFLQQEAGIPISEYGVNYSKEISDVYSVSCWRDNLYFCHDLGSAASSAHLVKYDLRTGTLTSYMYDGPVVATRQGLLVPTQSVPTALNRTFILLDSLSTDGPALYNLPYDLWLGPKLWEDEFHYRGLLLNGEKIPIDAAWESRDLTFGEVSYTKTLRRIGLDVTGPIRVIVKSPEYTLHDAVYDTTDVRARRFLWIPVEMPYECSFRIRFESVDGHPFRIHNGVDFYIATNQRN